MLSTRPGDLQEGAPYPQESPSADNVVPEYPPDWGPADWQDVLRRAPRFKSERAAAYSFLDRYLDRSIEMNREFYTLIISRADGTFSPAPVQIGTSRGTKGFNTYLQSFKDARIPGTRATSFAHTHGADTPGIDDEVFSTHEGGDVDTAAYHHLKGYLGTPQRRFLELLPGQTVGHDLGYPIPRIR